jgi:hypothetical protein
MADASPKSPQRVSLNKSTIIKRKLTLNSLNNSDSEEESPNENKRIKLPDILLNKLNTTKANVQFDNIPGLKSAKLNKSMQKRAMTEK